MADNAMNVGGIEATVEVDTSTVDPALRKVNAGLDQTAGKARNFQVIIQQAAYGLGDFASASGGLGAKLMAVSNNVQFVTASMGPWGAAAGLAVVGVAALAKNTDTLVHSLGITPSKLDAVRDTLTLVGTTADAARTRFERLEEAIKKIGEKPVKLALDVRDLEIAEEQLRVARKGKAAFDAAGETRTEGEEKSGKKVAETLAGAEGGERGVRDRLKAALAKQGENSSALEESDRIIHELQEQKDSKLGQLDIFHMYEKVIKKQKEIQQGIYRAIEQGAEADVGRLLAGAKSGDQDAQKALAGFLDQNGMGGTAQKVRKKTVEGIEDETSAANDRKAQDWENERQVKYNALKEKAETDQYDTEAEAFDQEIQGVRDRIARRKALKSDAKEQAQKRAPAAADVAESGTVYGMAMGMSPEHVQAAMSAGLKQLLQDQGLDEKHAAVAAKDLAEESGRKVRGDIVRRALDGPKKEEERKSEVFGAAELHNKLQTAVSNKQDQVPKKLDEIKDLLAQKLGYTISFK